MRVESRGRARALQALYARDLRAGEDHTRVSEKVWDELAESPEERNFAGGIVKTFAAAQKDLDNDLMEVTDNWRLERIGAIERSVLRLGAAELKRGETPPRVVIQEAVRLAERFGTAASARFVNGVLDAYARKAGVL
jgi:N utilization substance protein B